MKAKSAPTSKSKPFLTLEQRTLLFWQVSTAYNHPKARPISCEQAIKVLSDVEEGTSGLRKLKKRTSRLLDKVVGIPDYDTHDGDFDPPPFVA